MKSIITIPNLLTVSRIALLPFFVLAFFLNSKFGSGLALSIFVFCCITDYLDGYYARTYKQSTKIGQMLDPLADKVFISVTILFIAGFGKISMSAMLPAAIILCREIIISGVRDASVSNKIVFATSRLSKWKTATQMISIGFILIADTCSGNVRQFISVSGESIFWLSAIISIISGVEYCRIHLVPFLRNSSRLNKRS